MLTNRLASICHVTKFLWLIALVGLATACSVFHAPTPSAPQPSYTPDPLFQAFYNILGGREIIGEVISPLIADGQRSYQYTERVLMAYDPQATPNRRFYLAPIGLEMGVTEPPLPAPAQSDPSYVNGHLLYKDFDVLYERLGGQNIVGKPLTEARINTEKNRVEQYFEAVGFYISLDETEPSPHLLAYGVWHCDMQCRSNPPTNSIIEIPRNNPPGARSLIPVPENGISSQACRQAGNGLSPGPCYTTHLPVISFLLTPDLDLFRQAVDRLGGDLTGIALSDIYLAKDKMIEQIYENVVVSAPLEQLDQVTLRPLPSLLAIPPGVPEPTNNLPLFVFYPIQEQQGYNVPAYFLHYANLHGGLEVIGAPISRLIPVDENVFRQCFSNLCLEEHRNTPKGLLIRPAALGYLYKERHFDPGSADIQNRPSQEITLQIWEGNPRVASNQEQEIEVSVQQNGLPLSGAQPALTLTLPDGSQQVLTFPLTGEDGHSLLRLPPIASESGTLIRYQICLAGQTSEHFCVKNEYLIWNHP